MSLGFRFFRLDSSNLIRWDSNSDSVQLALTNSRDGIKVDRSELDIVYELILKYGLDLSLPVETRRIAQQNIYIAGRGKLVVCLAQVITEQLMDYVANLKTQAPARLVRVVLNDSGFANDVIKTNAIQFLRKSGVHEVKTVLERILSCS